MKQIVLLLAPAAVLASMAPAFDLLVSRLGLRRGYLAGFALYWSVWCGLVPWALLGTDGVVALFRPGAAPFGRPAALGVALLASPLLLGYGYAFPRAIRGATATVVLASAALALVNATFEELLWRGAYIRVFPGSWLLGYAYPAFGFALWHIAPQRVVPNRAPGGSASFVLVCAALGLMWGWVARASGSIVATTIAHAVFDLAGLGARIYFR